MAKYTMEIRELVSTFTRDEVKNWFMDYNLEDYLTADEIAVIRERWVWSKDQLAESLITISSVKLVLMLRVVSFCS